MKFQFPLTADALNLLLHIAKEGYAQYRDTDWATLTEFQERQTLSDKTDEWFLARNCNGTFHCIEQLY